MYKKFLCNLLLFGYAMCFVGQSISRHDEPHILAPAPWPYSWAIAVKDKIDNIWNAVAARWKKAPKSNGTQEQKNYTENIHYLRDALGNMEYEISIEYWGPTRRKHSLIHIVNRIEMYVVTNNLFSYGQASDLKAARKVLENASETMEDRVAYSTAIRLVEKYVDGIVRSLTAQDSK